MVLRKSRRPTYEEYREQARHQIGYVYLLRCRNTGWSKIGWTLGDVRQRVEQIRAEFRNGFDWRLRAFAAYFDAPGAEEILHAMFDGVRVTDKREWFVLGEASRLGLERFLARQGNNVHALRNEIFLAERDVQDEREEYESITMLAERGY